MAVTLSSKYQVVIPREVREQLDIRPGQRMEVFVIDGIIHIVPVRPIEEYRGFLKGLENTFEREEEDRF
jgi:AbrB family looped-hinge helix DNA binding protein